MTTTQERVTVSTRIELTALEARQVAAVANAASTDEQRPILCAILIEAGDTIKEGLARNVKFTATDSYVMAQRTIEVEVSEYSSQNHVADDLSVMVEAKAFAKALDRHGIDFKKHDNVRIVVTVGCDDEYVTVSATANQSAMFTVPIVPGTFPNYKQLIPSEDVFKPTSLDNVPTEFGFSPARIVQCLQASGSKIPGDKHAPVAWRFALGANGNLKPAYFETRLREGEAGFWGLIMPIRL